MSLRDELHKIHAGEHNRDERAARAVATIRHRLKRYARQGLRDVEFDASHPLGIPALRDPAIRKAVAEDLRNGGLTVIEKYYSIKVKW